MGCSINRFRLLSLNIFPSYPAVRPSPPANRRPPTAARQPLPAILTVKSAQSVASFAVCAGRGVPEMPFPVQYIENNLMPGMARRNPDGGSAPNSGVSTDDKD
jgi:hypothetical protein